MQKQTNSKILWMTRTAIFIALIIVSQAVTAPLGNTLVTGSIVNLILIVAVMTCGPACGLSAAAVSPVMAKLLGIGPLWALIPFIMAGNIVLTLVWHFIGNKSFKNKHNNRYAAYITALVAAAVSKFAVLYFGVVRVAVPLLNLPEKQAAVISATFSVSQLITASVGGALAVILLPQLKKAIKP